MDKGKIIAQADEGRGGNIRIISVKVGWQRVAHQFNL